MQFKTTDNQVLEGEGATYLDNLHASISADSEGNAEIVKNIHVDGIILSEGGIASNGTSALGNLEPISVPMTSNATILAGSGDIIPID